MDFDLAHRIAENAIRRSKLTHSLAWPAATLMWGFNGARDERDKYAGLGVATVHTTPERVLELVRSEGPKMRKVLKAAGVEPD